MRLKQIKLAGFKSFVDPTVISLPSDRCAVVGPNGCGKSNIVDAVRWVMGESSARQLRADVSTDVIFDGAADRSPVGMATIELLFDNSQGRAKGEFAHCTEIAVRRALSRDGRSTYSLNGVRCRRRDIAALFAGSGLGPRSYSIIEQGMISELVEAAPEQLRNHLEEAAGIAHYKDRRRETENAVRRTREHLDRVTDIRDELGRQVERLQRQARAAERFQVLSAEKTTLGAECAAIDARALGAELSRLDTGLETAEETLGERLRAEQSQERRIESQRAKRAETDDRISETEGAYYRLGMEMSRDEESLRSSRVRVGELSAELARLQERDSKIAAEIEAEEKQLANLETALAQLEPALAAGEAEEAAAHEALARLESAWRALDCESQGRLQEDADQAGEIGELSGRLGQLAQSVEAITKRLQDTRDEAKAPAPPEVVQRINELGGDIRRLTSERDAIAEAQSGADSELEAERVALADCEANQERAGAAAEALRQERATLEATRRAALGKQDEAPARWALDQGLDEAPRVGELISVAPGWGRAAEMVLGDFLQALAVSDLEAPLAGLDALTSGRIAFTQTTTDADEQAVAPEPEENQPLSAFVRASGVHLQARLAGIRVVDSEAAAMQARDQLANGESLIVQSGLWVGRDWVCCDRGDVSGAGIIESGRQLKALARDLARAEANLSACKAATAQTRDDIGRTEARCESLRNQRVSVNQKLAEMQAEREVLSLRQQQAEARQAKARREREQLRQQLQTEESLHAETKERLDAVQAQRNESALARATLAERREQLEKALIEARSSAQACTAKRHEAQMAAERHRTQMESARLLSGRLLEETAQLKARCREIMDAERKATAPLAGLEASIQNTLSRRSEVEGQLASLRRARDEQDAALGEMQSSHLNLQASVEEARTALHEIRLVRSEAQGRLSEVHKQIVGMGQDPDTVISALPEDAERDQWAAKIEQLARRITRLGAINMAAVEEFKAAEARKNQLDVEHQDVTGALETLEQAMARIDRETRDRFKQTFDAINLRFGAVFRKMFGGGQACLALTGSNLLDTGVTITAQPPGKRNGHIHLLSGGEKAMVAIALVFAIFEQNPSPVCLLDEVDAPLDDANAARFAELITEMSAHVQFVLITHNKLTMDMAGCLVGVTMREAGVSRIVSVDLTEAVAMAGA